MRSSIKHIGLLGIVSTSVFGAPANSTNLLDCNIIFEQRKGEIRQELQAIDERQQALQVLQNATQVFLDEKARKLQAQEKNIDEKIIEFQKAKEFAQAEFKAQSEQASLDMKAREEYVQELIARNEELLEKIQKVSNDKVIQTYIQMKDAKSAAIISQMSEDEAVEILSNMDSKDMGKILAKMDDQKAAAITQKIRNPNAKKPDELPKSPDVPQIDMNENTDIPNVSTLSNEAENEQDNANEPQLQDFAQENPQGL